MFGQALQGANQQNRQQYQQRIAALRMLPRGADRRLAAQEAKQLARTNRSDIRAFAGDQIGRSVPYGFEEQLGQYAVQAPPGTVSPTGYLVGNGNLSPEQELYFAKQQYPNLFKTGAYNPQPQTPVQDVRQTARTSQVPSAAPQPAAPAPAAGAAPARPAQGVPTIPGGAAPPRSFAPGAYPQAQQASRPFGYRNTTGIPDRGAGPYGNPGQTQKGQEAIEGYQAAQQALLGPLAGVFGLENGSNFTLTRGDVPLLEAGLNFENVIKAEQDRGLGYGELARGRNSVGSSPYSNMIREVLAQRGVQGSGELEQALQAAVGRLTDTGRSGREATSIRDSYTRDADSAIRSLREDYARRGVAGNEPAFDEQRLRMEAGSGMNRALSELESRQDQAMRDNISQVADLALSGEGIRSSSIQQLQEQLAREEQLQASFDQALGDVYLGTEREPFDFSGLTTPLKDKIAGLPVAGPNKVRLTAKDIPQRKKGKGYILGQDDPLLRF